MAEPLAAYAERAREGMAELVTVIARLEAGNELEARIGRDLKQAAVPVLWDVLMLADGATKLLLSA